MSTKWHLTGSGPNEEMTTRTNAVIEAFVGGPGSVIKAFLVANDLWSFDLEKASKRDRIATGLARARAQDRFDEILATAEDTLALSRRKTAQLHNHVVASETHQRPEAHDTESVEAHIVISHAAVDAELVRAVVELLRLGCDVPRERIICTSIPGMGVPQGEPFTAWIRDRVRSAGLIVAVITPAYYDSVFCCCELGAWWALEKPLLPLLVPPLGYGDLQAVLTGIQAALITERAHLDSFHDEVRRTLFLGPGSTATWSDLRDRFLSELEGMLDRVASSPKVPREALEAVREQLAEKSQLLVEATRAMSPVSGLQEPPGGTAAPPSAARNSRQGIGFFGWTGSPNRVWLVRPDGNEAIPLTDPGEAADPDWSGDGRSITFSRWAGPRGLGGGPNRRIMALLLPNRGKLELTDATWDDHQPVWSPADDHVAFIRSDPRVNNHHIACLNRMSGDQWLLTPTHGTGQLLGAEPTWSPDGDRIMFWGQGWEGPGQRVYVVNRDGSEFRDLVGLQNAVQPSWSPNGKHIAFIHEGRLCVADSDGTGISRLEEPFPTTGTASWHPDSAAIAVTGGSAEGSIPGIYVVPINGPARLVANTSPSSYDPGDFEPSFDETGELVVFIGADGGVWITDSWGIERANIFQPDRGRAIRPRFVARLLD